MINNQTTCKRDSVLANILVIILFTGFFIGRLNIEASWRRLFVWSVAAVSMLALAYILCSGDALMRQRIFLFIFLSCLIFFLNWILVGNVQLPAILSAFIPPTVMAGLLLLYKMRISYMKIIFCCVAAYFAVSLFILGIESEHVLIGSRNYISYYLVLALVFLYVAYDDAEQTVPVLPAMICFVFAVFAVGRGGIIMTGILFAGTFIGTLISSKYDGKRSVFILLAAIAVGGMILILAFNLDYLRQLFSSFAERQLVSISRFIFWREYSNALNSFVSVLLGASYPNNLLHNSYLQTHAFGGIFYITAILIMLVRTGVYLLVHKKYQLLSILLAFSAKSLVDTDFPMAAFGEIYLVYFIFYPYIHQKIPGKPLEWQYSTRQNSRELAIK